MFLLGQLQTLISAHPYLVILGTIFIIYKFFTNRSRKCDLPGPTGLPLVGYLPFLTSSPYKVFADLAKTYGPIYQLRIGRSTTVVISSLELGIEAYNDIVFNGRPDTVSLRTFANTGKARFAFKQADERWRFLRKVASRSLGLFASSRNSKLEEVISEAQDYLETSLDSKLGKAFNPGQSVLTTVSTVIGSVLFGFSFDNENPIVSGLLGTIKTVSEFLAVGGIVDVLPFSEYIMTGQIKKFKDAIEPTDFMVGEHLEKHEYQGEDEMVRDVADALVKISEEATPQEMAANGVNKLSIRHVASDLFGAGFATTTDSFRWFLNLIGFHEDAQLKCQQLIDSYLEGRKVSLGDRGRMPYVDATITEMLRHASLIPLSLPHSTMDDVKNFHGYFIPKGATVLLNIYAIHNDPNIFAKPEMFLPERFLRDDGSFNSEKAAKVIVFGLGKRRCVGESLARQEMFMLLVSTLQKYNIKVAPAQKVDFKETKGGFTRMPHDLDLIFSQREIRYY